MDAAILVIYGSALVLLGVFGVHRFRLLSLYARNAGDDAESPPAPSPLPRVTVQLPVYNELYVVERLIRSVGALDYPAELLEVQVLDDSTDETSAIVERLCAEERARGLDIVHVRRGTREGFKAGALAAGLARARGELLAIFDADFVPPPGFLRAVVPHFGDERVGMAQARWDHLNRDYSLLTRIQSILLDGHFAIEQTARSRAGLFFNFNGTAGVWRRRAIEEAGGWQHDTLTEDLDLSYRAQMRGWKFVYLPSVLAPAELPVEVRAFKTQQCRWAKGSMQTARKILPALLSSPLPVRIRIESVLHLLSNLSYVAIMALSVLMLPVLAVGRRLNAPGFVLVAGYLALFLFATVSVLAFYSEAQRSTVADWRTRWASIPLVMALGVGLSVSAARAVVGGLFQSGREFVRTPKYAIVAPTDRWREKRYARGIDLSGLVEVFLGLYFAVVVVDSVIHRHYFFTPFAVLFLAGFLYVGILSLFENWARPAASIAAGSANPLPDGVGLA